jgi:ElaB/YqjD/DUF883 family membrane-anchored ribosome-binding protein
MAQQTTAYPLDYSKGPAQKPAPNTEALADAAADRLKKVADSAEELAGNVAQQAREYGEKAQAAVQNLKPFVKQSLKDQPMSTLAAAAAVGFLLGALWKR